MSPQQPLPTKEHSNSIQESIPPTYHIPKDTDVICGKRGNANSNHPGNKNFSLLIRQSLRGYLGGESRTDRTLLVATMVESFRCNGVKFLKQDPATNQYIELSSSQTHTKVGHAIRDHIKNLGYGSLSRKKESLQRQRSTKIFTRKRSQQNHPDKPRRNCDQETKNDTTGKHERRSNYVIEWPSNTAEATQRTGWNSSVMVAASINEGPGVSSVLLEMGPGAQKQDPFYSPSVPNLVQHCHDPRRGRGGEASELGLTPDWTESSAIGSSLLLTPLPVNSEPLIEACGLDEIRDLLKRWS